METETLGNLRRRHAPAPAEASQEKIEESGNKRRKNESGHLGAVVAFVLLLALSIATRLPFLGYPPQVVFDEVHFGGFASKYITGNYFMDVHPPLGKLLITLAGFLSGFDGVFDFKEIGKSYIGKFVPYTSMRLLSASLGLLIPIIGFRTVRNFGYSLTAATITGLLLVFDNALTLQSRLILLDVPMLFFITLTVMFYSEFQNVNHPFSSKWWLCLIATGANMGFALSVKWVGFFLVATIGVGTLRELWLLWRNMSISILSFGRQFMARALALIVLPIIIYVSLFYVHFLMLSNSGTGTAFMSVRFQQSLQGAQVPATFKDVGVGSDVYLRHVGTSGGYLHSHTAVYRTGSGQQQITLYPFRDENSAFTILPALQSNSSAPENPITFSPITHGSIVRLEHKPTRKRLHSHDVRPPMSEQDWMNEVSAYGSPEFVGDTNDNWRFEIVDQEGGNKTEGKNVEAIKTVFRLVHDATGCELFSHKVKLPNWGFEQQEVTCAKGGLKELTTWVMEFNTNPFLPANALKVSYEPLSFFEKFFELQAVMWATNNDLTGSHPFESRPWQWPFLSDQGGIGFWSSNTTIVDLPASQLFFIGNPVVWWSGSLAIVAFMAIYVLYCILNQRGMVGRVEGIDHILFLISGWSLHYFPFFLMGRQLFFHHYLPSLYFSLLIVGGVIDVLLRRTRGSMKLSGIMKLLVSLLVGAVAYAFWALAPLTYGLEWDFLSCERTKWRTWAWDCAKYSKE